jgi:hypothetical protein
MHAGPCTQHLLDGRRPNMRFPSSAGETLLIERVMAMVSGARGGLRRGRRREDADGQGRDEVERA